MNPAKRKGSKFEADLIAYLRGYGFPAAERRVPGGTKDRGDVAGVPGWTLEAKAERAIDLAGSLTEAKREAANAGTRYYAAIHKRRMHGAADSYVVMPLSIFARLISGAVDDAAVMETVAPEFSGNTARTGVPPKLTPTRSKNGAGEGDA